MAVSGVLPCGEQIDLRCDGHHAVVVEVSGGLRSYEVDGRPLLDGLVPFIPGLRDIPRWIPIHRLIWATVLRDRASQAALASARAHASASHAGCAASSMASMATTRSTSRVVSPPLTCE
jgi:hypothetical protein